MDELLNMEELDNIIELEDENGNPVPFEFLDLISYQEEQYVVLLPVDEDSGEVVILRVEEAEDPDQENYVGVEDEEILVAVFEIFKEKFADEFNFAD